MCPVCPAPPPQMILWSIIHSATKAPCKYAVRACLFLSALRTVTVCLFVCFFNLQPHIEPGIISTQNSVCLSWNKYVKKLSFPED